MLSKFILALLLSATAAAQHSTVTIHVGKSGVFSGFGHEHTVVAPISRAAVSSSPPGAEIIVNSKDLKVIDKEVSDSDRAKIQSTMLGPEVLDVERYPEIRFRSSRIEPAGPQQYRVAGTLELHGVTKPVAVEVRQSGDHYQGRTKLRQTEFGIKPVSAGGGTVKVKDELEIEFDVYPGEFGNGGRR